MTIAFKSEVSLPFELVLVTRNSDGDPTGTKSLATDSAYKLSEFYLRTKGKPKKKHKDAKGKLPATEKDIKAAVKDVESYVAANYDKKAKTTMLEPRVDKVLEDYMGK